MAQGPLIREFRDGDYPGIVALWKLTSLANEKRGDTEEIIRQSLHLGGKFLVMISKEKEIIGTSWITFDGRRLHLHHFGIHPLYQQKGLGRTLALESMKFAKEKNVQIKLEVHQSNEVAIKLYEKLGFRSLGDYRVYIIRDVKNLEL